MVIPRGKNPVAGHFRTLHGHTPMLIMFNVSLPTSSLHLLGQESIVMTFNSKMRLFTRTMNLALISSLMKILIRAGQIFLGFIKPIILFGQPVNTRLEGAFQPCFFYQARMNYTFAVLSVTREMIAGTQIEYTKSARSLI